MFIAQDCSYRRFLTGTGSAKIIKIGAFYYLVLYYKTVFSDFPKKNWNMVGPGIF